MEWVRWVGLLGLGRIGEMKWADASEDAVEGMEYDGDLWRRNDWDRGEDGKKWMEGECR